MDAAPQVNKPFGLQTASNCSLCSVPLGFRPSCRVTLDLIATDIATNNDGGSCSSNYYDKVITYMLRWQPEVLCSSMSNFGYPVSSAGTLVGVLDMRTTTQCGMCAAMPCLPGSTNRLNTTCLTDCLTVRHPTNTFTLDILPTRPSATHLPFNLSTHLSIIYQVNCVKKTLSQVYVLLDSIAPTPPQRSPVPPDPSVPNYPQPLSPVVVSLLGVVIVVPFVKWYGFRCWYVWWS